MNNSGLARFWHLMFGNPAAAGAGVPSVPLTQGLILHLDAGQLLDVDGSNNVTLWTDRINGIEFTTWDPNTTGDFALKIDEDALFNNRPTVNFNPLDDITLRNVSNDPLLDLDSTTDEFTIVAVGGTTLFNAGHFLMVGKTNDGVGGGGPAQYGLGAIAGGGSQMRTLGTLDTTSATDAATAWALDGSPVVSVMTVQKSTEMEDTYLDSDSNTTVNDAVTSLVCDYNSASDERVGELRFQDLVNEFTIGGTVTSAQLDFEINTEGQAIAIIEAYQHWEEGAAHDDQRFIDVNGEYDDSDLAQGDTIFDGVHGVARSAGDIPVASILAVEDTGLDTYTGPLTLTFNTAGIDFLDRVLKGETANNGFFMYSARADGTNESDGMQINSSKHATIATRPKLTVNFTTPSFNPSKFDDAVSQGNFHGFGDSSKEEISGMVASQKSGNEDVYWYISDGANGEFHAMDEAGADLGTWTLTGVSIGGLDLEEICYLVKDSVNYLFLLYTGDNAENKSTVKIVRVVEPAVGGGGGGATSDFIEITCDYGTLGSKDVEGGFADPATGDLWMFTKRETVPTAIRLEFSLTYFGTQTLYTEDIWPVPNEAGFTGSHNVTGGAISDDGLDIILINYNSMFLWHRASTSVPVLELLQQPGIRIKTGRFGSHANAGQEPQGEAVCFDQDDKLSIRTLSERGTGTTAGNFPFYKYLRVASNSTAQAVGTSLQTAAGGAVFGNDAAGDTLAVSNTATSLPLLIGGGHDAAGTDHNKKWDGGIAEVLIYDRVLTAEEITSLQTFYASKYGVV